MNKTDARVQIVHYPNTILAGQGPLELQLTVERRITFWLHLPSAGIIGVCRHSQFMQGWGLNPGLCV